MENEVNRKICDESDFLASAQQIIQSKVQNIFREKEYEIALLEKTLDKHDPNAILEKGYAYLEKDGESVDFNSLKNLDKITIVKKEGKIDATITNIRR